ncbi:DUF1150 family protein [Pseudorhodobacter sp.]|uniref:DUF1150 family protein n=1 Tax=Pseudorhodobacter sp. TaxID=1934400 RepID=UPI002649EAD7|nr:DUF1150 family protein [Pseudorhodobacter sp.]MDN5787619.1 DUF1150 domain-containing protein [Pseudorhodobacter sp.]
MNTRYNKLPDAAERIVYVRPVEVSDLPEEVREQADGLTTIYAVHRGNGERLALVADKRMAFALAREHDLAPVSVH